MSGAPLTGGGGGSVPMLHDVKLRRTKETGYVKADNVPPEEIYIHAAHRR